MPSRSQKRIRRDINNLKDTVENNPDNPVLTNLKPVVVTASDEVNNTWQDVVDTGVKQNKEAFERDSVLGQGKTWLQSWRPLILILVPGAAENLKIIPSGAPTVGTLLSVIIDTRDFVLNYRDNEDNPLSFAEAAITDLGTLVEDIKREGSEAHTALIEEERAEQAFKKATDAANTIVVQGSRIVRAIFGATSPDYKRLIARSTKKNKKKDDSADTP